MMFLVVLIVGALLFMPWIGWLVGLVWLCKGPSHNAVTRAEDVARQTWKGPLA